MPHSGTTIPLAGQCWRDQITKSIGQQAEPSPEAVQELLRRHVSLDELTRGPVYERVMTLSHLGFTPSQISQALIQAEEQVRYLLRSARSDTWRIIEEHLNGYTAQEIAELTDFSKAYVYRILKKYNFRPHVRRAPELTSRQQNEIIRRYREGEAQKTISRMTGATVAQVKYLLKRRFR